MDGQVLMWTAIVIVICCAIGIPIGLANSKAAKKQAEQMKYSNGGIKKAVLVNTYLRDDYWLCDFKVIYNNGREGIMTEVYRGSPQYNELIRHV